jgi:predicted ATPase/DNA-binding winged helix-turn-helix (wHTH) protein
MSQKPQQPLYFSGFHIPAGVDLLYERDRVIQLEPRAVRVLRYLVDNHERVISKEELLDAVWPDVFTTDGVLKRAVSQARRALGDLADEPRFIATYHGRGYRFIAEVTLSLEATALGETDVEGHETKRASQKSARPALELVREEAESHFYDLAECDLDFNQMVGREAELGALRAQYRRALSGGGQPVVVIGDPGIGKTQLARDFAQWATRQGAVSLAARFFDYPASRLAPYELFLDLLRTALGSAAPDRENTEDLRSQIKDRLGVTLPEELFAAAADSESTRGRAAGVHEGDNFRAVAPVAQCFTRLSCQRPLVIVFDDLQWADEASLEVIGYLLRTARSEPLMIVALARAEDANDPNHPFAKWLKRQANYRSYWSLALKPLDNDMCRAAIEAVFGGAPAAPVIPSNDLQTLHRITGGNPFFLMEMLRLLVAERAIDYSSERRRWEWRCTKDLRLPDTLVMAARDKLDRLSGAVRQTIECAAVIGVEFRVETLARVSEREEEEIERHLRDAIARGVLSERGLSAGEDCRFYHSMLRHVLYDDLPLRRRKRLHARAARALEVVYADEADRVAEAVSAHYEAAGELRPAFDWSLRAWRAATSRWNWTEATECIERARHAAAEHERAGSHEMTAADRLRLLAALGETYYSVARLKESQRMLTEAVELAESLDDQPSRAYALLQLGQTLVALSQYREAAGPTAEALEAYARLNNRDGEAQALVQLSSIQTATGNYEMAAALTEQALERVAHTSAIAAAAFGLMGWARTLQGYYGVGVPLLERAADYFDRAGDVARRAVLLRRLHWAHLSRGQFEVSIELARQARDDYRRIGDTRNEAKLNMGIGQARLAQGLYEEAIELLNQARDCFRAIGETHTEAETFWLLGRAHCETGKFDEAAAMFARSLILVRSVGDRDDEFRVLTDAARLSIAEANYTSALRAADEAIKIAEELKNRHGLGAAMAERSLALLGLNDVEQSLEAARQAIEMLDDTESSERWRAYRALALALDAAGDGEAVEAMRQCVGLLEDVRDQLEVSDAGRRVAITRARREPARELHAMLERAGLEEEAKVVSRKWMLGDGDASPLSLVV